MQTAVIYYWLKRAGYDESERARVNEKRKAERHASEPTGEDRILITFQYCCRICFNDIEIAVRELVNGMILNDAAYCQKCRTSYPAESICELRDLERMVQHFDE